MKFSPSKIKTFMGCQLQAKYQYVDKIGDWKTGSSAHFGSAVHSALEAFHNGASEDEAITEFKRYFESVEPDYWNNRTSYGSFMGKGPKMIQEYIASFQWTTHVTLGTEKRFMVPFGEHLLSGIVDHIYTDNEMSKLYLSDLKTGTKPNANALHLDVQFTSYDFASRQKEFWCGTESDDPNWPDKYNGWENGEELYEIFKDAPRVNIWYDLRSNKPVDVGERADFDYARLYRVCEQIARAVEFEVFVPTINYEVCNWCDFKDLCPIYWEKQETENNNNNSEEIF